MCVIFFPGLCYAEFGARVPRAGSAYVYSYVTMGEFVAFLIGWTLILEYVIGSASVVRGLSTYVDALFNNSMRNAFESAAPIDINHLSSYPDFFAFGITLLFSGDKRILLNPQPRLTVYVLRVLSMKFFWLKSSHNQLLLMR